MLVHGVGGKVHCAIYVYVGSHIRVDHGDAAEVGVGGHTVAGVLKQVPELLIGANELKNVDLEWRNNDRCF